MENLDCRTAHLTAPFLVQLHLSDMTHQANCKVNPSRKIRACAFLLATTLAITMTNVRIRSGGRKEFLVQAPCRSIAQGMPFNVCPLFCATAILYDIVHAGSHLSVERHWTVEMAANENALEVVDAMDAGRSFEWAGGASRCLSFVVQGMLPHFSRYKAIPPAIPHLSCVHFYHAFRALQLIPSILLAI